MKNKFKKIIATTMLSITATAGIGCATTNSKIAQKINNGVEDFVSSINKLDYVDTNNTSSSLGKIVSAASENTFLSSVATNTNIENTITRPTERTDNFKLYVLSSSPYISLTSDDNNINLSMQFSTEKIETTSDDISEKINKLILKRAILMVYVNEIYSGNVELSEENRKAINAYVNVIKENASFLNGNRGMVKNQLGMASNLINNQQDENIINYYIIKSGEALEIRSNKIDSTISSIESIISILEQNLTPSSCYYQKSLTTAYENMLNDMKNNTSTSNENNTLAKEIAESINLINTESTNTATDNNTSNNQTRNTQNNYNKPVTLENLDTNKPVNNNTLNNNSNQNQANNHITKDVLEKDYLSRKTQNSSKISENQSISNQNSENLNNLTPSERARIRRRRRNQTRINNQNTTQNNSQNNQITNSTNNDFNPTVRQEKITPVPYRDNNQTQTNANQNTTTNANVNNNYNRATRVPYKIPTNID